MKINPVPSREYVGGKGLQLIELRKICNVPDFFIIYFDDFNEINRTDVQNEIYKYFLDYGFSKVAVRSSATIEDSDIASFAGMFETELNVTNKNIINAIKKVLLSVSDERVKEYCSLNNLNFKSVQMRIIVQCMINSRVSGVCFTKDSNSSNMMLIEACYGLGEALVSGLITPDTYKVNRNSLCIMSQNIGFQKYMYDITTKDEPIPVPFHRRNAKKLTDIEIVELAQTCIYIEKALNYFSADIEWAYEGEKLYLLQVRPFIGIQ